MILGIAYYWVSQVQGIMQMHKLCESCSTADVTTQTISATTMLADGYIYRERESKYRNLFSVVVHF